MQSFYWPGHLKHDPGLLPQPVGGSANYYSEVPARAEILRAALLEHDVGPVLAPVDHGMDPIHAVHEEELTAFLRSAHRRMEATVGRERVVIPENFAVWRRGGRRSRSIWGELGYFCYDTSAPIFAATWDAAYWSAQCALSAADQVAAGAASAYALCRPPGHHAGPDSYGGFCYLNNAAIAAHHLIEQGARVAIVDIDFHHGNGTQAIFYNRNDLFFCSLHVDPNEDYPFYWGFPDERGAGAGEGFTANYPLSAHTGLGDYLSALDAGLAQVRAFGADCLVISLGFDGHRDDPVGGFQLDSESFAQIGAQIGALACPLVLVQEGGYAISRLSENLLAFLSGAL